MRFGEDTEEYRWFHGYSYLDTVLYDGKIYEWGSDPKVKPHRPINNRVEPPYPPWVKVTTPSTIGLEDYWYSHSLYLLGEKVFYKGVWYECIYGGEAQANPETSPNIWQKLSTSSTQGSTLSQPSTLKVNQEAESLNTESKPESKEGVTENPISENTLDSQDELIIEKPEKTEGVSEENNPVELEKPSDNILQVE